MATTIRTNTDPVAAISAYAAAKLIAIDKSLAGPTGLPQVLNRIAVTFTVSGAPTSLKGTLYWDSAGNYVAVPEFTFAISTGLTTAATYSGVYVFSPSVRITPMSPNRTATGTLYLGLLPGANNVSVAGSAVELWAHDDLTATG